MEECKELMLHRGKLFLKNLLESRCIIAKQATQFITDGCVSKKNCIKFYEPYIIGFILEGFDSFKIKSSPRNIDKCFQSK